MVDAATFIDPVVPVESERAAGAFVKKGMRSLMLWYVGWVTHQVSQSAAAVSRALHIVDDRLGQIQRQLDAQRIPRAGVVEIPGVHGPEAWWVDPAVAAVAKATGRILHTACGDGWLVRRIEEAGGDAYGVDPRAALVERAELGVLDLRAEAPVEHLGAVAAAGLGAVVLTGTVEGMGAAEREELLDAIDLRLAPDGTLVIHSASRATWERPRCAARGGSGAGPPPASRRLVSSAGAARVRG